MVDDIRIVQGTESHKVLAFGDLSSNEVSCYVINLAVCNILITAHLTTIAKYVTRLVQFSIFHQMTSIRSF